MAEIVWRPRAVRHLSEIFHYLNQRSPLAAERYASGLSKACYSLVEFPEKAPRYNDQYRALAYRNHLVLYRYDRGRDSILITAIIDARRDVSAVVRNLRDAES